MTNQPRKLSTKSQHKIILEQIQQVPKNTFDLRDQGIVQVPTRVSELRDQGHNIISFWSYVEQDGEERRIGAYVKLLGKWKKPKGRVKLAASLEEALKNEG